MTAAQPPRWLANPLPRVEVEHLCALVLFCAYFFFKPFYLLPSGLPQPADALAIGAVLLLLLRTGPSLSREALGMLSFAALFVAWISAVDMTWAIKLGRAKIAIIPLFYVYNLLLVFAVQKLAARFGRSFLSFVAWTALASLVAQAVLSIGFGGVIGRRAFLFFNNPNQLGYWTILMASTFFVCATRVRIPMRVQVVAAIATTHLVLLSLSKAAILSLLPLFALAFARRPRHLIGALLVGAVLLTAAHQVGRLDNVAHRISNIGKQDDDNFSQRGYKFIWNDPEYTILGAGEGAPERFRRWDHHELHSTFATVLFCYGAVGFALFGAFLWSVWASAGWWRFGFIVPAFVFGIAHQGLRSSTFWVLLAVLAVRLRDEVGEDSRGGFRLGGVVPQRSDG